MMIIFLTQWLIPTLYLIGLIISIWAFRNGKKKGYIVVAIYFFLSIFSYVVMPRINRAIRNENPPSISEEKREEMYKEIDEICHRYYEIEGLEPEMASVNLKIPFGDLVLVTGLWLLARKEDESEQFN